ncbi:glycosyltransferase family 4 protein [Colwellia sp. Bg11-12]|uniref:glycosyltransferase family 4 protein n=1 Tax=Colwellia sp. Bg11-12 TaxID=2759817 RepID=UPI0015F4FE47|nr:glycosyltransferase family 4 protein [Colwellia sp. Bg11-12]MBA6265147.1 glycosyltransferase family 4 protein [Colwellia sp. Bg11-12]
MPEQLRILEVVQSLEKGGRTTRFIDTVLGLREQDYFVVPLCLSTPEPWVNIQHLTVIQKTPGINWQLVFQIRKIIKQNNINVVHAHCEFSQLYASIAGFTCGIKTVATFHRSDLSKYQPNLVNKLIKFFASFYIAVSHDRLTLLTNNLQLPKNKCSVVHGGAHINEKPNEDSIKSTRNKLGISDNEIALLSIGHLGAIKGHQDTLRALARVVKNSPNIHLYIAGDGTPAEKKVLIDLATTLDINQFITFLGQINNAPNWIEACDIFIQPSIEEAFGLVFVEAGAKAKPVIATAVGGIKEIIISSETGLLVAPAAPQELEKALALLINSTVLRVQYGDNAYKRITENFSLTNMVNKYIEIFNKVVK